MPKYNVSLKARFEIEAPDLAQAVQGVIFTLTDTFENVRGLELTNLWEVKEFDNASPIQSEAPAETSKDSK